MRKIYLTIFGCFIHSILFANYSKDIVIKNSILDLPGDTLVISQGSKLIIKDRINQNGNEGEWGMSINIIKAVM